MSNQMKSAHLADTMEVEKPPLKPFTVWSAMSLGYSISNSGLGMVLVVGSAAFGAGPLFIYGTILITAITFCVAITLGELASAYPHSGAQYFYVAELASEQKRRFLSYMTGIISWAAVVCIGASACSALSNTTFALIALTRPDFEYKQWMGFLVFVGANWTATIMVIFERFIPVMSSSFVYISLSLMVAIFITLLASNTEKASVGLVFGTEGYFNVSGWSNGVAFMIGISSVNWGFSCLDAATHLAEEIPEPRRNIPKALLWTVGMGFIVAFPINIAVFFKAPDLENTFSILGVLYAAYSDNATPALALGAFMVIATWGAVIGMHTWQSRIVWSMSRDRAFPFHSRMSRIAPAPFRTPLWAILWGSCWITICGFLYLASTTAFNSFISAGIILQYMSYAAPAVLLLRARHGSFPKGPFWWPRFGPIANLVVVIWTVIITVFYSFPLFLPVEVSAMNYVVCVLVFAYLYAGAYWVFYGRKHYRLVDLSAILD
ncbi:uncharacterized protein A1O9_01871 [Exophiala aquamarina CBS 119918]|uniref:Amino acid permease/ SLC12A domain-containing protein n=1 Tax=Exophiala aquamarina CBS 119918 TaxID=1182545 RepID=A0A072PKD0_9EURO|nr:uncharacterized protein A1O9_01871 [Exophiala aquamarina CBS 119918]KEF60311.1 hypothetical protein A1O9_01871 [Exophiala aquamarina CBS 119918]